jgi:ubiquinone/menaquinone biosynthesis C-methylase UbiE
LLFATVSVIEDAFLKADRAFKQGDLDTSARFLRQLLERDPDDHRALALMAEVRLRENDVARALALYARAVNAAPGIHPYKKQFLVLARRGVPIVHDRELENAIAACLKTPDLAAQIENWAPLLMADAGFRSLYGLASRRPFDPANRDFFSRPLDLQQLLRPLFLEGLKSHVVCEPLFEEFVTHLRRQLLEELGVQADSLAGPQHVELASAVSHYAFLTDFILDETPDEQERVARLKAAIEAEPTTAAGGAAIATMACYRPLWSLRNASALFEKFANDSVLAGVVRAQIGDDIALRERARSIRSITPVDETSAEVRRQYEEFPYPRWKKLSLDQVVQDWRNHPLSQTIERSLPEHEPKLLVAGCGTGRDAVMLAAMFPRAEITAVDISRTSLAYGALKSEEHGCGNITFLEGDLLHLRDEVQMFDYICSTGVLHHMDDPAEGLKTLYTLLKPAGVMLIGLYSRKGRKAIVAAQDLARQQNYPSSREGILRFRRESPRVFDRETLLRLSSLRDYYHMSMYRDLLFPAKEHRFDLLEIKEMLRALKLSFEGFYISTEITAKYRAMFPHDPAATDLDGWHRFESRHPETFASMYIFLCRKAGPQTSPRFSNAIANPATGTPRS